MQAELIKKLKSGSLEYISAMTAVHSEVVLEVLGQADNPQLINVMLTQLRSLLGDA
jgi:hypothetical protein